MNNFLKILKIYLNKPFRQLINARLKLRLKNQEFSVISANCVGAVMLHDVGERFNSPFVNLYLSPQDFLQYLSNIPFYQNQNLTFEENTSYPIGNLGGIRIHFLHYHTEQEAKAKWLERSARLNLDNLFIIMTDRDGCRYEDLQAFDQLPFKNKVVFTHKPYPELKSAFYVKGFEQQGQVGDLIDYSGFFGKRHYDQIDWVNWFNQK